MGRGTFHPKKFQLIEFSEVQIIIDKALLISVKINIDGPKWPQIAPYIT